MTESEYGPISARRTLAAALYELRTERKLRGADVASAVGRSASWVSRLESGVHPITVQDVMALTPVYEIGRDELEHLTDMARANLREGWWEAYKGDLSKAHSRLIALEAEATTERVAGVGPLVPGIVQTKDYAHAVIEAGPDELTPRQIDQLVGIRQTRQAVLHRADDPLRLSIVLDETVLRRMVGGEKVMREQIWHLIELAKLPRVTIQVLPLGSGAHAAMEGPFTILEFSSPVRPAAYVGTLAGETWIEQPEQVGRFMIAHASLTGLALPPADTISVLASMTE